MLAARAHRDGRAYRTASVRHRALAPDPLGIVAWQLGAEPYTVAALAMGPRDAGYELYVPGYPLNRDLLFTTLTAFATDFCVAFEATAHGPGQEINSFGQSLHVPYELAQIVVANVETVALLGRLGRRLAYLPTDGDRPADPLLPRLGRHLMWLSDHAQVPGQQLIVPATELLSIHYQTAMSVYEAGSLPALDAWIDPPAGVHAFDAAVRAERQPVGPRPEHGEGEQAQQLMRAFNSARAGSVDPQVVQRLIGPLRSFYDDLVGDTWRLMWRCVDRERGWPLAPSVERRAWEDRKAYAEHVQWMNGPAEGRRRTRRTSRTAALRLNTLETAQAQLGAEEAIDDPLRMASVLLAGKAVAGTVVRCEADHTERINNRNCKRPRVTLQSTEPCVLPIGKHLWWTESAQGREWSIEQILPTSTGGSTITLVLQTNRAQPAGLPTAGVRACFSALNTRDPYQAHLPRQTPWTHRPVTSAAAEGDIEDTDLGQEAA